MEPSPYEKFRDIIDANYSAKEERELDDKADEIFEDLDYQAAKRFDYSQSEKIFDWEVDEDEFDGTMW